MRRHLFLALSFVLAATAATAGIATAGASTTAAHEVINIAAGSKCTPKAEFCFAQGTISVSKGTKVTWKNKTLTIHTVTRCDTVNCAGVSGGTGKQTGFGSPGTIAAKASYSFVFRKTGTYVYYCQVHGYTLMHGTITVT